MFSVSAKTQYGIRALVHLARLEATGSAPALLLGVGPDSVATGASIAKSENISPKYLEGILAQLTTSGLLVSERGKKGGYRLARPASSIRMSEIVEALEGEVRPVGCVDDFEACTQGPDCLPRLFWCGLKDAIDGYLESKTLRDVLDS
jgi:Rrf2 family protein